MLVRRPLSWAASWPQGEHGGEDEGVSLQEERVDLEERPLDLAMCGVDRPIRVVNIKRVRTRNTTAPGSSSKYRWACRARSALAAGTVGVLAVSAGQYTAKIVIVGGTADPAVSEAADMVACTWQRGDKDGRGRPHRRGRTTAAPAVKEAQTTS